MIVVSADRPPEVRGADANQTIVQPGIFGGSVRHEVDLPLPSRERLRQVGRRSVAGLVDTVVRRAFGPPGGPVHLNVPFAKPLQPPIAGGTGDPRARGSPEAAGVARGEGGRAPGGRALGEDDAQFGPRCRPRARRPRRLGRRASGGLAQAAASCGTCHRPWPSGPGDASLCGAPRCPHSRPTRSPALASTVASTLRRTPGGMVDRQRFSADTTTT